MFRRQALDRCEMLLGVKKIVTGNNADDIAYVQLSSSMFYLHDQRYRTVHEEITNQ